jgi:hypothetical protein
MILRLTNNCYCVASRRMEHLRQAEHIQDHPLLLLGGKAYTSSNRRKHSAMAHSCRGEMLNLVVSSSN